MAFREKMLWASLVATLWIWGWYFIDFVRDLRAGHFSEEDALASFIQAVVLLVVVQIVAAIVLASTSGRDAERPADDRERAFALSAYRPAYIVLSACVVTVMIAQPIVRRVVEAWTPMPFADLAPVVMGNALLASLVLAQLVHDGWQIVRFRMGG